jgi:hypothetical protein
MVPDTDGVVNGPLTGTYEMFPKAGTTPEEVAGMGDATGSIGLGRWATADAVNYLDADARCRARSWTCPSASRPRTASWTPCQNGRDRGAGDR